MKNFLALSCRIALFNVLLTGCINTATQSTQSNLVSPDTTNRVTLYRVQQMDDTGHILVYQLISCEPDAMQFNAAFAVDQQHAKKGRRQKQLQTNPCNKIQTRLTVNSKDSIGSDDSLIPTRISQILKLKWLIAPGDLFVFYSASGLSTYSINDSLLVFKITTRGDSTSLWLPYVLLPNGSIEGNCSCPCTPEWQFPELIVGPDTLYRHQYTKDEETPPCELKSSLDLPHPIAIGWYSNDHTWCIYWKNCDVATAASTTMTMAELAAEKVPFEFKFGKRRAILWDVQKILSGNNLTRQINGNTIID